MKFFAGAVVVLFAPVLAAAGGFDGARVFNPVERVSLADEARMTHAALQGLLERVHSHPTLGGQKCLTRTRAFTDGHVPLTFQDGHALTGARGEALPIVGTDIRVTLRRSRGPKFRRMQNAAMLFKLMEMTIRQGDQSVQAKVELEYAPVPTRSRFYAPVYLRRSPLQVVVSQALQRLLSPGTDLRLFFRSHLQRTLYLASR